MQQELWTYFIDLQSDDARMEVVLQLVCIHAPVQEFVQLEIIRAFLSVTGCQALIGTRKRVQRASKRLETVAKLCSSSGEQPYLCELLELGTLRL